MENENNVPTTDFKQQIKTLEEQVQKLNKRESDSRDSMEEELLMRRAAELALNKIYLLLGFVAAIIAIVAFLGFPQITTSLVNRVIPHIEKKLEPVEKLLVEAKDKAMITQIETKLRLEQTQESLKRHREDISVAHKEFNEARDKARQESQEIQDNIRADLQNLKKMTDFVRAPLPSVSMKVRHLPLEQLV